MAHKVFRLIISVAIALAAGFIGSLFTASNVGSWYAALSKPPFTPPNWIFAPVWTVLYILMGVSFSIIWNRGFADVRVKIGFAFFIIQLIFNILWSLIFFQLHLIFLAFCEIILLWLFILAMIVSFARVSKVAAFLQIPYILWVSFAAVLNFALWLAN